MNPNPSINLEEELRKKREEEARLEQRLTEMDKSTAGGSTEPKPTVTIVETKPNIELALDPKPKETGATKVEAKIPPPPVPPGRRTAQEMLNSPTVKRRDAETVEEERRAKEKSEARTDPLPAPGTPGHPLTTRIEVPIAPPRKTVAEQLAGATIKRIEFPEAPLIEKGPTKVISTDEIREVIKKIFGSLQGIQKIKKIGEPSVRIGYDTIKVSIRLEVKTGLLSSAEGEVGFSMFVRGNEILIDKKYPDNTYVTGITGNIDPKNTLKPAMETIPGRLKAYFENKEERNIRDFEIKNGQLLAEEFLPAPRRTVDEMLAEGKEKERMQRIAQLKAEEAVLRQAIEELRKEIEAWPDDESGNDSSPIENFKLPEPDMLTPVAAGLEIPDAELMDQARQLAEKCHELNAPGKVMRISQGPVVTVFEFKPDTGIKYSRVVGLADDLCLALKVKSVRIERVPGKDTIGIEVPNATRDTVSLRRVIESKEFRDSTSKLTLALGQTANGANYVVDLKQLPHLLIGGAAETGKSEALNAMLLSMLHKASPNELRLIIVDSRKNELSEYKDIPHLMTPIITEPKEGSAMLKWAVSEMEVRYKHLAAFGVRNIDDYNSNIVGNYNIGNYSYKEDAKPKPLPYIAIVIDELGELMSTSARETEENITKLAMMARAVGIHLIVATERPSIDTISGLIKANFPARIAFRTSSKVDSRTLIDANGAETLLGQGDMLFLPPSTSNSTRIHSPDVSEQEVKRVCDFIRSQGAPIYDKNILQQRG